jgi:tetratricopeptide (TPR) repeat protein
MLSRAEKIIDRGTTSTARAIFFRLCRGYLYDGHGDLHNAIMEYYQALDLAGEAGDVLSKLDALTALGVGFVRLVDYAKSLEFYLSAYEILADRDEREMVAISCVNIGGAYMKAEDWETAEEWLRRALIPLEEMEHSVGLAGAYANLGAVQVKLRQFESAHEYLERALRICQDLGMSPRIAWVYGAMGEAYLGQALYEQAGRCLARSLAMTEEDGNERGWIYGAIMLADAHIRQGNATEAVRYLTEAQRRAAAIGYPEYECEAWQRLAAIYRQCDRVPDALEAFQSYLTLRQAVHEDERRRALVRLQIRYATWEIETERRYLRAEKQRLEDEVERKEKALTSLSVRLMHNHTHVGKIREDVSALVRHRDSDVRTVARELLCRIDADGRADEALELFERRFIEIDQEFFNSIVERFPALTRTEAKVCCLLRNDLNTKEIATVLCTSVRTVESHRRFIRRKLSLPKQENLVAFLAML